MSNGSKNNASKKVHVSSLGKGDVFRTRRGDIFEVLDISEFKTGEFHREERTKFEIKVHDRQLDKEYSIFGMDNDKLELVRRAPQAPREDERRGRREPDPDYDRRPLEDH